MKKLTLLCLIITICFVMSCGGGGGGGNSTGGTPDLPIYSVTFNSLGGSAIISQEVTSGSMVLIPNNPEINTDDTVFTGWYKESGCINKWNFVTDTVSGDITLYANWGPATSGIVYTLVGGVSYSVKKDIGAISGSLSIPKYHSGKLVTIIDDNAFISCSGITSIDIPNSVTTIGVYAFFNCTGITSLTIPNSVITIGDYAFANCTGITSLTIPDSVTSIGNHTFGDLTGLTSLSLGSSLITIGMNAFSSNNLTNITIPHSVTTIGDFAFSNSGGLTSVTIPVGVTTIGAGAFGGCRNLTEIKVNISSVNYKDIDGVVFSKSGAKLVAFPMKKALSYIIPAGVTTIGKMAFVGCSGYNGLTSVTIPNSVTTIEAGAFQHCTGLTSITIPNSVTTIGDNAAGGWGAFQCCAGLTSLTIPSSVTFIGWNTFATCDNLTRVNMERMTPPTLGPDVFHTGTLGRVLHIHPGATGYNVDPWTNTSIFIGIAEDL